jgi:TrmH family RNA methyltransferase
MIEIITSPQNKLIKQAAALKQKKHREELGLFMVEGVRLCEDFAASDWLGEICLFTREAAKNSRVEAVLAALAAKNCRLAEVPAAIYDKVTDTEQPQGIMVLAAKRRFTFDEMLSKRRAPLIAVLDGIQDPGNVGAMIRTADAVGCSGVVLTTGCADLFAGKTVRATMGSLFHLPIIDGFSRNELLRALTLAGTPLLATALESAQIYHRTDLTGPVAIAFGNEGAGMSQELLDGSALRLYIPIYGAAESLNVATAAAVVLYEAARQRFS